MVFLIILALYMCGISGYYCLEEGQNYKDELINSLERQEYRGPNDKGFWSDEVAGLAHARLSIIDLSSKGHQPMILNDNGLRIVYNGEVYNYKEIRNDLETHGFHFISDSDTEVILKAYIKWGKNAFERFNGMFAIAIYDEAKQNLILARDRFGIKPLYYYMQNSTCFFASELGSLLAFPIPRKIHQRALKNYFKYSYIPNNESIIAGVEQLKPGVILTIDKDGTKQQQFYSIPESIIDINYDEALVEIKKRVEKSVERRLIADVPVASYLSSGLDSSIITQISANLNPGIVAFSAGFSENKYFDESILAKEWGHHLNIDHQIIDLKEKDLLNSVKELLDSFTEPFADSSSIAYYLLSKHVSKEVKVVLSGDGADELFGGYRKHKAEWVMRNQPFLKSISSSASFLSGRISGDRDSIIRNSKRQMRKWINASKLSNEDRYLYWASMTSEEEITNLLINDSGVETKLGHKLYNFNDVLKEDFNRVLTGDMLYKVDRTSMLNGLEVRVPFLDHELVDLVFSLPSEWKLKNGRRKALLKDAFRDTLPNELIKRRKKGFEVPLKQWLNGSLSTLVDELLNEKTINEQEVLNYATVKGIIEKSRSNQVGNSSYLVWSLLVFQSWMNKYNPTN